MAGLPKKYAKMGFKRGWASFKKLNRKTKKTKIRSVQIMARKRSFKRSMKRYSRKAKSFLTFGTISKVLIGAAIAAIYEVFVSPMIPLDGMIKNIVELGAGLILASMGSMPMPVRAFGAALSIINAYSLIVPLVQNFSGTSSTSGASSWSE